MNRASYTSLLSRRRSWRAVLVMVLGGSLLVAVGCSASRAQPSVDAGSPLDGSDDGAGQGAASANDSGVGDSGTPSAGPDAHAPNGGDSGASDSASPLDGQSAIGANDSGGNDDANEPDSDDGSAGGNDTGSDAGGAESPWGCAEGAETCECYNSSALPAGYNLATCGSTYPCCISYNVDEDGGTFQGCDCYSSTYLTNNDATCAGLVTTIDGEWIYSSAATVIACPP